MAYACGEWEEIRLLNIDLFSAFLILLIIMTILCLTVLYTL